MAKFGDFNEIIERNLLDYRNNRLSPINNECFAVPRMMSSKINRRNPRESINMDSMLESPIMSSLSLASLPSDKNWKTELKRIYLDYEIVNSPSYFKSAVPMILNWDDSRSCMYTPDFTKDGSEFGSRANSIMSHVHSNLSELQESSRRNKKFTYKPISERSSESSVGPFTDKKSSNENSKKFKITKTRSIDANDEESGHFAHSINSYSSNKHTKSSSKQLRQSSYTNSTDKVGSLNTAKIVKPSGPTKWANVKSTNMGYTEGNSINSHD